MKGSVRRQRPDYADWRWRWARLMVINLWPRSPRGLDPAGERGCQRCAPRPARRSIRRPAAAFGARRRRDRARPGQSARRRGAGGAGRPDARRRGPRRVVRACASGPFDDRRWPWRPMGLPLDACAAACTAARSECPWRRIPASRGRPGWWGGGPAHLPSACATSRHRRRLRPWGIDVCSGVERAPGRKDPAKLRALFEEVRDVEVPTLA